MTTTVYIVRVRISSGKEIDRVTEVDKRTDEVTYHFVRETRKSINGVANRYRYRIFNGNCLDFNGLRLCKADALPDIQREVKLCDADLKAISSRLRAVTTLIPISLADVRKGEVYNELMLAIKGQVFNEILERVQRISKRKKMTKQNKAAALKLLDRLAKINVVEDADVVKRIREAREAVEREVLQPVAEQLKKEVEALEGRGAFLEL